MIQSSSTSIAKSVQLLIGVASLVLVEILTLPLNQRLLAAELSLGQIFLTQQDSDEGFPPCTPSGSCERPVFDRSIPHLISPRATALTLSATENLVVQWSGVEIPDYTPSYTVTVRGLDGSTWQEEVTDTTVVYDGDPLQPGGRYIISVDAHIGEPPTESIFWILSAEEEAAIARQLTELDRTNLSEAEYAVVAAKVYQEAQAFKEAIEVLETAIAQSPNTADPYCELISVYQAHYQDLMALDPYAELVDRVEALGINCSNMR